MGALLRLELQGAQQSSQSNLDRTRGEASVLQDEAWHARAVAEQENAAMINARNLANQEAAATQYARNVAHTEAVAAQSEASQASALHHHTEQARLEQAEREVRDEIEFANLRRELEHYEAREVERNSEAAARRSAPQRTPDVAIPSDERAGNFRIYTPSPTSASPARTTGRTLQSPITLLSQPEQRDFILEDGYDALDPNYWIGHQPVNQGVR